MNYLKLKAIFMRAFSRKTRIPPQFGEILKANLPRDMRNYALAMSLNMQAHEEYQAAIMTMADSTMRTMAMSMAGGQPQLKGALCACMEAAFLSGMMVQKRLEGRDMGPAMPVEKQQPFYREGTGVVN